MLFRSSKIVDNGMIFGCDVCQVVCPHNRDVLYDRINRRVDIMLENGLLDEALWLYKNSDGTETSLQAIGYKEFFPYFKGEITLEEAIENLKKDTRHYAKRQLTWFRRDKEGIWVNLDEFSAPEEASERCLEIMREKL